MAIYDISVPLSPTLPTWPNDPAIELLPYYTIAEHGVNVSAFRLGTHSGTHVDAPFHFLPDGGKVDELALDLLLGPAWVADCRGVAEVTADTLEDACIPRDTTRLLLLTDNSTLWNNSAHPFHRTFVDIAESGAVWLVDHGVRLVGIDYMSVDNIADPVAAAHLILLPNKVIIVENLDLRQVPPNRAYELICLPLRIVGGDGAPARALLRDLP